MSWRNVQGDATDFPGSTERPCAGCGTPAAECEPQGWCCQSCRETKGGSHG